MRFVSGVLIVLALGGPAAAEEAREIEFFEARIRPVLVRHCYECHSAEAVRDGNLKGGLQLDTRAGIRGGGDSGAAVVPGMAEESLLLAALRYDTFEMPPRGRLPAAVIADFERWIQNGAVDPRDGEPVPHEPTIDLDAAREFWSLRPVARPVVPRVQDEDWPAGDVDRFVLAKLDEQGLEPVGDADRATLLRRVSFDLLGLPPTPRELDAFLADASPSAYERVVDEMLASPHFGERWGRHWLDLARYSESCGSTRNMVWRHAWRYRDYVVEALDADLPYDRFVREQIAGDLLPADDDAARDRQVVATAFLALGPKALDEQNVDVFRMDRIDEQIDTVSQVFLGLSVACARCHDHKFDPVPTADYYALAGIFASTDPLYGLGPQGIRVQHDTELRPIGPDAEALDGPAAEHRRRVGEQTQTYQKARSDRYRVVRRVADAKRMLDLPGAGVEALAADVATMEAEIAEWDARIETLKQELDELQAGPPPQPAYTMAVRDASEPRDVQIHVRGETTNLGDRVPRGVLRVLPVEAGAIGEGESGRRQLADWIASPHNPLTPRVAVNRVWQHLLGRGLVRTVNDFGVNGARPSHPELLDHLAGRFVSRGWSVKQLVREIVLSRTYRLSSDVDPRANEVDPENEWLWRMRPRRLEAEAIRDAVLVANGRLDRTPLAGSVVEAFDPFTEMEFNFRTSLTEEQRQHRHRSLYLPVVRGDVPEVLAQFDFADPSRPVGERDVTLVPAQASFLTNSPWIVEESRHFADRLFAEEPDDEGSRVERLYRRALSRPPTSAERQRITDFLAEEQELSAVDPDSSPAIDGTAVVREKWASICQVVLASAEFRFLR
jgi:hypothetical protein